MIKYNPDNNENDREHVTALEEASVRQNIAPFSKFLADLLPFILTIK